MNATYTSPEGLEYTIHETTFINPGTGLETLLFVMVNESGAITKVTASSVEVVRWVREFDLVLQYSTWFSNRQLDKVVQC
jgi:hypothetical protein